ncbi:MAG: hypothetical protein ACLU3I_13790 [Acutalibacteraceae bacterium]|jgi:hypothetical protein
MERLTSPNINVDPDTDRFLHAAIGGKEIDWKQCRDSTLNVLINGPTSNGFGKDIFRKMVRDLYGRLKAYEDTGLTPEEIKAPFTEDAMINLAAQALGVEPSRLRELAEADRNHQIVIRPCKIGDTVWAADTEPVIPLHVMADAVYLEGRHGGDYERLSNFGSVVFLSQEEAKEAASHWMK